VSDERESGRFISGIYNYCDRWCERCRFSDRCMVYAQEQEALHRHELSGEDPEDPQVFMSEVEASLGQAMSMLEEMAAEAGVDLKAAAEEPEEEPAPHGDPLFKRAEGWGQRIGVLLEWVGADIATRGQQLVTDPESGDTPDVEGAVAALTNLRDAAEMLGRYRLLIAVKLARALRGSRRGHRLRPGLSEDYARDDAHGTAKLVDNCLTRAAQALWVIGEFSRPWLDMAMPLAMEAEAMRRELEAVFPGFAAFHRPGFDDEPA